MKKIVIKDHCLFAYITAMCLIDVVCLTLWQVFDGVAVQGRFVYETRKEISAVVVPFSYMQRTSSNSSELMAPADQLPIIQNFR